ncbi:MAG: type II secretion system protein [candidate division Zixibacteria bacterium]|nr:type II secretion system protein [candidate division Zixibacteria bacterium]
MSNRLRRNTGFTLIELMVSIIIMSIAGGVLYYMFNQGQALSIEEEHRRLALGLAQNRMAAFKLLSDNEVVPVGSINGEEYLIPPDNEDDNISGIMASYTIEIEEENGLYTVSVVYEWNEHSGLENHVMLVNHFLVEPLGG